MSQAKNGDTVKVRYTGILENGKAFANSKYGQPYEFTVGTGSVIPGIEKGIIGMEVGETKTIKVPPQEAFGQKKKELIANEKKSDLPTNITPAIGKQLKMRQPDGTQINVVITGMDKNNVTLDANHPLAGRTLIFHVELVDIPQ